MMSPFTLPGARFPVRVLGSVRGSAFGVPAFGRSAFGRSAFGRSVFGRSVFGRSVFGRSVRAPSARRAPAANHEPRTLNIEPNLNTN
jgi:hypothetical protein